MPRERTQICFRRTKVEAQGSQGARLGGDEHQAKGLFSKLGSKL